MRGLGTNHGSVPAEGRSGAARRRLGVGALLITITIPLLTGCAGPAPFSDYSRQQDERDVLPDLGEVSRDITPESVRYAGSAEGIDVYLGSTERAEHCVIVDAESGPVTGCSGSGPVELSKPGSYVVQVHADGEGPVDSPGLSWTMLGDNVSIRAD